MTSTAAVVVPSPRDVFGADARRAVKLYERAVEAVLEQCKVRLRRGVPAKSVTIFLRSQYVLCLAPLAAGVEILQDAVLEDAPRCTCPPFNSDDFDGPVDHAAACDGCPRHGTTVVLEVEPRSRGFAQTAGATLNEPVYVDAGTVRYSPFGNAAPRPLGRKQARA